jgi:hypothetical protein
MGLVYKSVEKGLIWLGKLSDDMLRAMRAVGELTEQGTLDANKLNARLADWEDSSEKGLLRQMMKPLVSFLLRSHLDCARNIVTPGLRHSQREKSSFFWTTMHTI